MRHPRGARAQAKTRQRDSQAACGALPEGRNTVNSLYAADAARVRRRASPVERSLTGGDKMFSWPLWHNEAKILPRSSRMIHVRIMERSGLVKMIGEHRCPRREVSG